MQIEYIVLCKSIRYFDLRCWSRKLASSVAFRLASFKVFCLDVVASVWSSIVRCIISANILGIKKHLNVFPIPPTTGVGGILGGI